MAFAHQWPPTILMPCPLFFFCYLFFTFIFSTTCYLQAATIIANTSTTGFTLELIHVDDKKSPLYHPNLTDLERYQRLLEMSEHRRLLMEYYYSSSIADTTQVPFLPPVNVTKRGSGPYFVIVGIGTPPVYYHLALETALPFIWTQCLPCNPCFHQPSPIFNPSTSSTYHKASCNDPLCEPPFFRCVNGECVYSQRKGATQFSTSGHLARERFTARSGNGGLASIDNIAFGCSTQSTGNFPPLTCGALGLGNSPESFAMQLSSRFSYCLPYRKTTSYLQFGNNIRKKSREVFQSTALIRTNTFFAYYLNLIDISVNGHRLHIPPGTFDRHANNLGGCTIDAGFLFTYLITEAYDRLKEAMVGFFENVGMQRIHEDPRSLNINLDLCYYERSGFHDYPTITLHFGGSADILLRLNNNFIFYGEPNKPTIFCLAYKPLESRTIIGSFQQYNIKFIYNVGTGVFGSGTLEFAYADCSTDGAD